jgi:glycosyltransferase involved in cell wall biosynthesis
MHILFLSHYFPPETNAPAIRTFENAKRWVMWGHRVTVVTCAPNHPEGIVFPGYKNRLLQWEDMEGIRMLRVITLLSANSGVFRRILNHVSFLLSVSLLCGFVKDVDLVVSTSPQFFCGMAGYVVSRIKGCPWILEIRDLWPESIVAVGAMKKGFLIRLLERLERFLYHKASHIVSLTRSFKNHIVGRGVPPENISVITNGADLKYLTRPRENNFVREKFNLGSKFIVSYIGTFGLAHKLETVLEAATLLKQETGIVFVLIGNGAERERLVRKKNILKLENVLILPRQPRETIPGFLDASDACMVLLRKRDVFQTVIPSKIFEAMAMARPIILGVEGECRAIVEEANCGLCVDPENHRQLVEATLELFHSPDLRAFLGQNGRKYVERHYDREELARRYLDVIEGVLQKMPCRFGARQ